MDHKTVEENLQHERQEIKSSRKMNFRGDRDDVEENKKAPLINIFRQIWDFICMKYDRRHRMRKNTWKLNMVVKIKK